MHSLFWRKTRYLASASVNPRENCLTEAFASVLERVEDLPFAFLEFLDPELRLDQAGWRARVTTQKNTWSGRIIDLEIEFVQRLAPHLALQTEYEEQHAPGKRVCWVEIKHGAGLSDPSQLTGYLADIEETGAAVSCLSLLAPRDSGIEVPDGVIDATWQKWALRLSQYRRHSKARREDPVEDWLIGQFLRYLREEALMDEPRLTVEHAFILAALPATAGVLSQIWDVIDGHVQKHGGKKSGRATRAKSKLPLSRLFFRSRDSWDCPRLGRTDATRLGNNVRRFPR